MKGSDAPEADRRTLLTAQILFWLLAATDGHAKNFSIFLSPGGRFRLTPLYDIMSAQPAFDARQLPRNKMKLALAVGARRHYVVSSIVPRHFVQTAEANGMPATLVREILDSILERADGTADEVLNKLPRGFPEALAESIVAGFRHRLRLCEA